MQWDHSHARVHAPQAPGSACLLKSLSDADCWARSGHWYAGPYVAAGNLPASATAPLHVPMSRRSCQLEQGKLTCRPAHRGECRPVARSSALRQSQLRGAEDCRVVGILQHGNTGEAPELRRLPCQPVHSRLSQVRMGERSLLPPLTGTSLG